MIARSRGASMVRLEFPKSTIMATSWLMTYHPERLPAWYERHPPADRLEAITKEWMAKGWCHVKTEDDHG
jgi:hypothetical protein